MVKSIGWKQEPDGQMFCKMCEVFVRGKDGKLAPIGDRANEKINNGALNAFRAALIEKLRGHFVVFHGQRNIVKLPKIIADALELPCVADS